MTTQERIFGALFDRIPSQERARIRDAFLEYAMYLARDIAQPRMSGSASLEQERGELRFSFALAEMADPAPGAAGGDANALAGLRIPATPQPPGASGGPSIPAVSGSAGQRQLPAGTGLDAGGKG